MDDTKENVTQLRKTQAPIALRSLQTAITEYVEDMNTRLQAGLAVRQMPTSFEVHELEKVDTLPPLSESYRREQYLLHSAGKAAQ